MKKAKGKGRGRRPAVEQVGSAVAVPEPLPTTVFLTCQYHTTVTYRVGGFCEKCYADTAMQRVKKLDDTLAETVVDKFARLVKQVLDSGDVDVIERFLGRVMSRFDKPKQTQVSATLKAVHLHAPVDFGAKRG